MSARRIETERAAEQDEWTIMRRRLVALGLAIGGLLLAAGVMVGVATMKSPASAPAPPPSAPAKLEVFALSDTVDLFSHIPPSAAAGIEVRSEEAPVGIDDDGG